jgi:predicted GNAT family acetyltransferase
MEIELRHDRERRRFIARTGATESHLVYAPRGGDTVDFLSTYVAPAVRGRGVGEKLVREALEWAKGQGLAVIPSCWFVDTVVRRHPEYETLLVR